MPYSLAGQNFEVGHSWYSYTYPDTFYIDDSSTNTGWGNNYYPIAFVDIGSPFSILDYFLAKYNNDLSQFPRANTADCWDADGNPTPYVWDGYSNYFALGYTYDTNNNSFHFFGGFYTSQHRDVLQSHNDVGYTGMSVSAITDTDRVMARLYFFTYQELYMPDLTRGHGMPPDGEFTMGQGFRSATNLVYCQQTRNWDAFDTNVQITGYSPRQVLIAPACQGTTPYFSGTFFAPRPSSAEMPAPDYYGWYYGYRRDTYVGWNYHYLPFPTDLVVEDEEEGETEEGDTGFVGGGGGGGRPDFTTGTLDFIENQVPQTGFVESGFGKLYNPGSAKLLQISQFLWSDDFIDNVKQLNANALDCVYSLVWMPINLATMKNKTVSVRGGEVPVFAGNVSTRVTAYAVNKSYGEVKYTFDTKIIREQYGMALDYSDTTIQLFLPFIGYVDIQPDDLFSPKSWTNKASKLKVHYIVNLFSGDTTARVYIQKAKPNKSMSDSDGSYTLVIGQYDTNIAFSIPLTGANYSNFYKNKFSSTIGAVGGMTSTLTGIMTGNPMMMNSGMLSMANNAGNAFMSAPQVMKGGCSGGGSAPMSAWTPYVEVLRPASVYNEKGHRYLNGLPTSDYTNNISSLAKSSLNDCLFEFQNVNSSNFSGTEEEEKELLSIMSSGIFINS